MLSKLRSFLRQYEMVKAGDRVVCAVSGGADSVALLFAMYLLKDELQMQLEAAHFNHHLRGEESDRDEAFVRALCDTYDIPLHLGGGEIVPGKKGLEAAAREARYAFFATLPGKTATAHTADDNAETVLMHLVRGTGLKGLGGIAPVRENLIRPMLGITRQQVLAFLQEYHVSFVEDSTNAEDTFLRNRIRHQVMPILMGENPKIAPNLSKMAMTLRYDEEALQSLAEEEIPDVYRLRELPKAIRSRMLEKFLKDSGVKEPEQEHIALAESLVFSDKPSASGQFPGGVCLQRNYDRLEARKESADLTEMSLPKTGEVLFGGMRIVCGPAEEIVNTENVFTVSCEANLTVRSRQSGDMLRLSGGSKSVKKRFIDKKVPAHLRNQIPVVADKAGVVGVYGLGADIDRRAESLPARQIRFEII